MNTIIEILMDRDCLSYEEAKSEFEFAKKAFWDAVEGRSLDDPFEVLYEYLGLEPDYIDCLL